ncbi:hypothetical protein NDU88_005053 [Pleurodeles waltl]|uniref:Uncharacterized protein n=1 Tax=Pleurodeles waltl TaxID=8319 RepID=A0AAV7L8D9_PLEWA|nr:hypothetical protein NDU88_005053 [Pleurodeles waltl]
MYATRKWAHKLLSVDAYLHDKAFLWNKTGIRIEGTMLDWGPWRRAAHNQARLRGRSEKIMGEASARSSRAHFTNRHSKPLGSSRREAPEERARGRRVKLRVKARITSAMLE